MGMIHRIRQNKNVYGNFFLATEAPGDTEEEVTEETRQRRNVKVITVRPDNRRRKGFEDTGEDVADDEEEAVEEVAADETEDTEEFADTGDDVQDEETQEEEPAEGAEQTDNQEAEENVENEEDTEEFADNGDDVQDEEQTEEGPAEQENEGAPDENNAVNTDGADDFADGGNDVGGGGTDTTGNIEATTGGDAIAAPDPNQVPGIDYDTTRKYNLYKEYMSLYNACENYISKLENILKDDAIQNQLIRIVVSNLREIKDCIYDYLTIRFQLDSYVQALIFYQKLVVSIQLSFNLLCVKK